MIWSKFNFISRLNNNKYLLFNTYSGFFVELDKKNYTELIRLKKDTNKLSNFSNSNDLLKNKVIVDDDNNLLNEHKFYSLLKRFNKSVLNLTIAPTLACNFRCNYCFENKNKKTIDDETIQSIINFIRSYKDIKNINITWFGGEPLLAFQKIIKFQSLINDLSIPISSALITNGYLLSKRIVLKFEALNIKFVQITIDGPKKVHNQRRPHANGKGSFDAILSNIDNILNTNIKNLKILIRVNIDNSNKDNYAETYFMISEKFKNSNVHIYPGFVHDIEGTCATQDCLVSANDKFSFLYDLYNKHKILTPEILPSKNNESCMARQINSFLIGPDGEMYKCWNTIGKSEYAIGNINNPKKLNSQILTSFMIANDHLSSPECNKCICFPLCDGGCVLGRNLAIKKNSNFDFCHPLKNNIDKILKVKYENI